MAFGLALSSAVFLAMMGGGAFFGLALTPHVAAFPATFTGTVSSVISLVSAQTPIERGRALAALATVLFVQPASFAAIIWTSLRISMAVAKYAVDRANS